MPEVVAFTWCKRDFHAGLFQNNLQIKGVIAVRLLSEYDADFLFPEQPVHLTAQIVHSTKTQLLYVIGK